MRGPRVGALAFAVLVMGAVSACKDTTSSDLGTVTCLPADASICPPGGLSLGYTGMTAAPTISTSAGTDVSATGSAYDIVGTTSSTTSGFWLLVRDGVLTSWGVLVVSGGTFTGTAPLVCGAQTLIFRFTNSAGTSYYVMNVDRQGCAGPAAFRVQLTWTSDPNSDLDLHLIKPGGTLHNTASDCHWRSCKAENTSNLGLDWGATGATGNPVLDVDDVNGYGPENIYLNSGAETGEYRVVVHNWDGTMGEIATVRIFFNDVEAARSVSLAMNNTDREYWEVARVNIATRTITSVGSYFWEPTQALSVAPAWKPTVN